MPGMQTLLEILNATWEMALAAAPWLVVGLVVAALIKVYVPSVWLTKFLRGRWGVIKAAFIGAPLPLCSCGVIPAALALRRQGASRGATMSFLVATPETGVDSVAVSYALLGPFLAVVRPVSAILSAIVTGLIGSAIPEAAKAGLHAAALDSQTSTKTAGQPASAGGCCGGAKTEPKPKPASSCCGSSQAKTSCCETAAPAAPCCATEQVETKSACCATEAQTSAPKSSCCSTKAEPVSSCCSSKSTVAAAGKPNVFTALIDAAAEVLGDTMKWLLIGLLMAGAISVFIDADTLSGWGSGLPVMLLMAVVGVPMYICATASTPLAAALLLAGLSPGAVLVFMLAGPATNVATLGVVRKELGTRYMVAYLVGVGVSAIGCGLATDAIANAMNISAIAQAQASHHHEMIPHWLAVACLALLVVLAIKPLRVRLFAPTPLPA